MPPWRLRFAARDLFAAWLMATVFSGIPSTVHAALSGGDPLEATWAAGEMLLSAEVPPLELFLAAGLVHCTVSAFWTLVFGFLLPWHRPFPWALVGAAAVAVLDLKVVAPILFPSVAELAFWPQFADHLAWGALLGGTLQFRLRRALRR